ncbi:MAG: FAD-dependent thymidylate synthase [Calditrichia bacterium]
MRVILSGYNIDIDTLQELKEFLNSIVENLQPQKFNSQNSLEKQRFLEELYESAAELLNRDNLTPETLSAAYARISRSPLPVNELRQLARQEVDRARKSNRNIIFGLGHSSVAEHAAFNFDIIGVSRLAVEAIEHFRLASYTEKSQRYVLFEDDYLCPAEIAGGQHEESFRRLIRQQNETYQKLYTILRPYFFDKYSEEAAEKKNHKRIEGLAKEDARYVISLATQTQLGMTLNARSLENMVAKCSAHPLQEVRDFSQNLYRSTEGIAPSIIKYMQPTEYLWQRSRMKSSLPEPDLPQKKQTSQNSGEVELLHIPTDADEKILAALLFHYNGGNFNDCLLQVNQFDKAKRYEIFAAIYRHLNGWDSLPREFEFIEMNFQLIVSASNFGQLKRHRMANLLAQPYDISLGYTIPDSIRETGQLPLFSDIMKATADFYGKLRRENPDAASYILTNAHRRRVLFKINLREFYHFSRLRGDEHAQWDIRQTAGKMLERVAGRLPVCGALLGGKDSFTRKKEKFFNSETF